MRTLAALLVFLFAVPLAADEAVIATWNLEWFYDADKSDIGRSELAGEMSAPSEEKYQERVETIAAAIAKINPDVLALQEIENKKVVKDLADELKDEHDKKYKVAFVQGGDTFTQQDVAFLVRDGLPVDCKRFRYEFSSSDGHKNLSKHLRLKTKLGDEDVTLVTVHLIRDTNKRKQQAKTLRAWTKDAVEDGNVIILGDFNTKISPFSESPSTDMGIIRGFGTPAVNDDLSDVLGKVPEAKRATHVGGSVLDRVLLSPSLVDDDGLRFGWIEVRRDLAVRETPDHGGGVDWEKSVEERDLSDHFPVVLKLNY